VWAADFGLPLFDSQTLPQQLCTAKLASMTKRQDTARTSGDAPRPSGARSPAAPSRASSRVRGDARSNTAARCGRPRALAAAHAPAGRGVRPARAAASARGRRAQRAYADESILHGFIHSSPAMQALVDEINKIRSSDVTVLVTGESGTGKELVGEQRPVKVDVRVVAATNCDLELMVSERRFREDLYYRLNVIRLRVPPCASAAPRFSRSCSTTSSTTRRSSSGAT